MSQIVLAYGHRSISLDFDDERFSLLTAPGFDDGHPLSDAEIGQAIDKPIQSPPLEDMLSPSDSVLLVVSDATRASGAPQIVNLLTRRIIENGVAPSDIRIIFATGIHRPVTIDEKRGLLTPFIAQRIQSLDHDANDSSTHVNLGDTPGGTHVALNRALKEYDHVILTGGVAFHYFAGFTGGRKSICPGLASAATIEATHMLALDFENGGRRAGVGVGLLDGNPVHDECERIASMVPPSFIVNTIVDDRGRVVRAFAGDWRAAHRQACDEYVNAHSLKIGSQRELVIVNCGGSPYDVNLIQAHKALDMATHACADGGSIILVAECAEGLGRDDFLKWFDADVSRDLEKRLRQHYEVNGQTAWSLLSKAERFRVYLVSSLSDEVVRRMRMIPARSIEEALADSGPDAKGYIMPHGSSVLPYV